MQGRSPARCGPARTWPPSLPVCRGGPPAGLVRGVLVQGWQAPGCWPNHRRMSDRSRAAYLLAALIGLAAALAVLPVAAILGGGAGWDVPQPDQAQSLTGHLAFQADGWRWPLLWTDRLFPPQGVSVALSDSNPLFSLVAKAWVSATGAPPVNLLGAWLALCWVMQPVAAVYAARGLRLGMWPCVAAGALAACWPALLVRMGHVNLCGHFLVILAVGLALRPARGWRWWAPATALLVMAALVQPYLFQLAGLVLGAAPVQAALERRPGLWRTWAGLLAAGALAVGVLRLLSGPLGGGDKGFVFFSMNLLSPVWPERSGVWAALFGTALPAADATGGQYEGYNWLGAGVLLLAAPALAGWVRRPPEWRPARGLLIVLAGLTLISLSSRVYAGHVLLLDLGVKPWEDIFGTFRSPGRAFWPVGYALMLAAVAGVARLPWRVAAGLLAMAAALQVADTGPLRAGARAVWAAGTGIPVMPVPAGATLFGVAPYPGCTREAEVRSEEALILLHAVQGGARVREIGLGRPPAWFNCEKVLAERLEEPLRPGEARAFLGSARALLRPGWLGAGAECRTLPRAVVCGRGVPGLDGAPLPVAAPPALALPLALDGAALAPVLGQGWREAPDGMWSDGAQGTLLLAVPPGPLVLTLRAAGIGRRSGEARSVLLTAGKAAQRFDLPDGETGTMVLHIPAGTEGGLLRVVLDGGRAVDPAVRGLAAPVRRTVLRLLGVEVRAE